MSTKFKKKCSTSNKLHEWGFLPATGDEHLHCLRALEVDILLECPGKTVARNFTQTRPKFCQQCVNKLYEMRPDLMEEANMKGNRSRPGRDEEDDQPPYKLSHQSPISTDNEKQTQNYSVYI